MTSIAKFKQEDKTFICSERLTVLTNSNLQQNSDLQRFNSAGNKLVFKADDWEHKVEKMHLECAAGDAARNIIEADNGITDIKHTVSNSGSLTTTVHTWYHCM